MERILAVSSPSIAQALELVTADITNPTELNAVGTAVPDWRLVRTNVAGSDQATLYRLDTDTDAVNAPYIMASATAGLRWVAIAGRYVNQAVNINGTLTLVSPLAIASGGTNSSSVLTASAIMVSNGSAIVQGPAGTTTTVLHGNAAGLPTYGAVSLTADVSGILPSANGGTGINNAGTITNANNTIITGGGTLALGGFTLTVPATGTAGLLGGTNTWTAANTFSNTTDSTTKDTGSIVTEGGIGVEKAIFAGTNITAGSALSAGSNISAGTANSGACSLSLNGGSGSNATLLLRINNADAFVIQSTASNLIWFDGIGSYNLMTATLAAAGSAVITWGQTLDATSSTSAGMKITGGLAIAKGAYIGTSLNLPQATGTTLTVASAQDSSSVGSGAILCSGGAGFAKQVSALNLLLTMGTITSAEPVLDSTVTWNAVGVTFTGWKLNVTSTASAAASLLMDLQLAGTSQFSVRKDSLVTMAGLSYSGAVNGELWHNTSQKCLQTYVAGLQNSLVGCIFVSTADGTVANTTTETTVLGSGSGTKTLPANALVAGKAIRIKVYGYLTRVSGTLQLKFKIGGASIQTDATTITNPGSAQQFEAEVIGICRTTGGSGSIEFSYLQVRYFSAAATVTPIPVGAAGISATVDTTTSNAVNVTATWSTASVSNTITCNVATIEVLN